MSSRINDSTPILGSVSLLPPETPAKFKFKEPCSNEAILNNVALVLIIQPYLVFLQVLESSVDPLRGILPRGETARKRRVG